MPSVAGVARDAQHVDGAGPLTDPLEAIPDRLRRDPLGMAGRLERFVPLGQMSGEHGGVS